MASLIVLGALAFVAVGLFGYAVAIYNGLVLLKSNIQKAWANIDVLLKQRFDEIPKLVKTCEAYMRHEKGALARVVELRNATQGAHGVADRARREGQLSAGLRQLFAVAENYPDLKAQGSFQQLQSRISDLENQLADRRELYNESVNNFNVRIQSFPDMFVAGFMRLSPQEMFKASEEERRDVPIDIKVP